MDSYQNGNKTGLDSLEFHLNYGTRGLGATGAMYRVMTSELFREMLSLFGKVDQVSTPYIFETVAEILIGFKANNIFVDEFYWIRNWQTEMVQHHDWNRSLDLYTWWTSERYVLERKSALSALSKFLKVDQIKLSELTNVYANKKNPGISQKRGGILTKNAQFRAIRRELLHKVRPSRIPRSLNDYLTEHRNNELISEASAIQIQKAAEDMLGY
jgi:hypothetical protein